MIEALGEFGSKGNKRKKQPNSSGTPTPIYTPHSLVVNGCDFSLFFGKCFSCLWSGGEGGRGAALGIVLNKGAVTVRYRFSDAFEMPFSMGS